VEPPTEIAISRTAQKGGRDKDWQEMMSCSAEKEHVCVGGKRKSGHESISCHDRYES